MLAHQRRHGHRVSARRRGEDVAQQVAAGEAQHLLAWLDRDPHRSAADEPGVPGKLLGQLVLPQRGVAGFDDALRFDEGIALDAAAPECADQATKIVDQELGADDLRGAAGGADDGRDREAAALPLQLGHPRVDLTHSSSIRRSENRGDARRSAVFPVG